MSFYKRAPWVCWIYAAGVQLFKLSVGKTFPLFIQDGETSSDDDDVIDMDHETVSQPMTSYFGEMRNELRGTKVEAEGDDEEEWNRPLNVDAKLLNNLLESYRSQDGAAGPATTLLEPLGLKLDKKWKKQSKLSCCCCGHRKEVTGNFSDMIDSAQNYKFTRIQLFLWNFNSYFRLICSMT